MMVCTVELVLLLTTHMYFLLSYIFTIIFNMCCVQRKMSSKMLSPEKIYIINMTDNNFVKKKKKTIEAFW